MHFSHLLLASSAWLFVAAPPVQSFLGVGGRSTNSETGTPGVRGSDGSRRALFSLSRNHGANDGRGGDGLDPCNRGSVSIDVSCAVESEGGQMAAGCTDLEPVRTTVEARPIKLVFRYIGESCRPDLRGNDQWNSFDRSCEDYPSLQAPTLGQNGAPSEVYVRFTSIEDDTVVYGEKEMGIGETIAVEETIDGATKGPPPLLPNLMRVTIYKLDDGGGSLSSANTLQTFKFRLAGNNNMRESLNLADRLGGIQLVEFEKINDAGERTPVTGFRDVELTVSVTNEKADPEFTIQDDGFSFSLGTAHSFYEINDAFKGKTIAKGNTISTNYLFPFDMTQSGSSFAASTKMTTTVTEPFERQCNFDIVQASDLMSVKQTDVPSVNNSNNGGGNSDDNDSGSNTP